MSKEKLDVSEGYIHKISEIKNYINSHYRNLNLYAVWLFVATLGSWSVGNVYIQLLSMGVIFFLFFSQVFENRGDRRPFKKMFNELEKEIQESALTGDAEKARYHEISEAKIQLLGFKSALFFTPRFIVCYSFWGLSFLYFSLKMAN